MKKLEFDPNNTDHLSLLVEMFDRLPEDKKEEIRQITLKKQQEIAQGHLDSIGEYLYGEPTN